MNSARSYGLPACTALDDACALLRKRNIAAQKPGTRWAILTRRFFYNERDRLSLERDPETSHEVRFFDSRKAAQAWIEKANGVCYRTSHNESGSPRYQIVREGSARYCSGLDFWGS